MDVFTVGIVDVLDMRPSKFLITSTETEQSVLWIGTFGQLEVKKVVSFGIDQLYFTTSVTVKNVGNTTLTDFICKNIITHSCYWLVHCTVGCTTSNIFNIHVWF